MKREILCACKDEAMQKIMQMKSKLFIFGFYVERKKN